jgi:hypothetical protein
VIEASQLATAMLTIAFTALMLVAGQQFIEYKSRRQSFEPPLHTVGVRMDLARPGIPPRVSASGD